MDAVGELSGVHYAVLGIRHGDRCAGINAVVADFPVPKGFCQESRYRLGDTPILFGQTATSDRTPF